MMVKVGTVHGVLTFYCPSFLVAETIYWFYADMLIMSVLYRSQEVHTHHRTCTRKGYLALCALNVLTTRVCDSPFR